MSVGCNDEVKKHLAHTESVVELRLELTLEVIHNLFQYFVSTSREKICDQELALKGILFHKL